MALEAFDVNQLLTDFKPLIHRTLQRLNISPRHMDYDDYYQELQIHLLNIRASFSTDEEDLGEEIERFKFTAYAGKGLFWHGLNLVKRQQKKMCDAIEETDLDWLNHEANVKEESESELLLHDFFRQAQKLLTAEDYALFLYLAEGETTIDEIAENMQVSRSTIYQRKARIQERLQGIKNCLTD